MRDLLAGWGHEVHFVSDNRDERALAEELVEGTTRRLPHGSERYAVLDAERLRPTFVNPRGFLRTTWTGRRGQRSGYSNVSRQRRRR